MFRDKTLNWFSSHDCVRVRVLFLSTVALDNDLPYILSASSDAHYYTQQGHPVVVVPLAQPYKGMYVHPNMQILGKKLN